MPCVYDKLFALMKEKGITKYQLRRDKVIGVSAMESMRTGTGHVDTRTLGYLCEYLQCQPGDMMEYIPENQGGETK